MSTISVVAVDAVFVSIRVRIGNVGLFIGPISDERVKI